jgi:predicted SAM-dependent methyltransferase
VVHGAPLHRQLGPQVAEQYIAKAPVRKLHIGCGKNILPDWLNMDYLPLSRESLYLDARRPFFLKGDTFDYVFSEHMIEHISYNYGLKMLTECRRVLKPLGKLRISTPDLAFIVNLYRPQKSVLEQEYIKWAADLFFHRNPNVNEVFVINYFMRNWGHTFIYDEATLRNAMTTAGFTNIVKCDLQESEDPALRYLENEARLPSGFLRLETITLEGTKPA